MSGASGRIASFSPERLRQLARRLNKKDKTTQIPPRSRETNVFPLSFAQERLWFLDRLFPGNAAYNLPFVLRFRFPAESIPQLEDLTRLHRSTIDELVRRHEILRTSFPLRDGSPVQVINPAAAVPLEIIELPELAEAERVEAAKDIILENVRKRFDLATGNPCRFRLIKLAADDYVGLAVFHHIVADAWSHKILIEEFRSLLFSALSGQAYRPAELPIQYADYAVWQREWWQQADVRENLREYWTKQLQGLEPLPLATDYARPIVKSFRGDTESLFLKSEFCDALRQLSQSQGVTLFATFLAAWAILLQRYTGENDIAVCVPVANRTRVETEALIGFFVNTLVVRIDISGNPSFAELQKRVWDVCTQAYAHQEMPFEQLVQELQPQRDLSRNPLSGISFQLQDIPTRGSEGGLGSSMSLTSIDVGAEGSAFDLDFSLSEQWDSQWVDRPKGIRGKLIYSTDLFERETIKRMLEHFQNLLAAAVKSPHAPLSELAMLNESERRQLLVEWNRTRVEYPSEPLQKLFEAQVAHTPGAVAVQYEENELCYADLNRRANQLAHYLRRHGVGPEVRVGICAERSLEMVVALLGIIKAGGAYVPLDPEYPAERLRFIAGDAKVQVLLTQQKLLSNLPQVSAKIVNLDRDWQQIASEDASNPDMTTEMQNAVYVIYTSGSTGQPKGAINVHEGLSNRLLWMQDQYHLNEHDRVLQKTPFTFDVSVWEFFWPLIVGARLVLARPGGHQDRDYLREAIQRFQITTLHFVPPMLSAWLAHDGASQCSSLKRVICSGEALNVEQQKNFQELLDSELHNLYGPTEASIDVTSWQCRKDWNKDFVPIGKPIANLSTYVVDKRMEPAPVGVAGELLLGGIGLARGYLNRPDLTAEKFIPNPFSELAGDRLYRTGDLVRYQPDGNLEFLGRIDHQVKIRGFRIELGEIETLLAQHEAIQQSIVIVHGDGASDKRLVAYIVGKEPIKVSDVRGYLRERVPEYMVPAVFVQLDAMPLNANGKIDRKALPTPDVDLAGRSETFVAPRTPTEQLLFDIWSRVLNVGQIGVYDSFFDVGGHSLMAMRLLDEVHHTFQVELPLRSLFEPPTIAGVAEKIEAVMSGQTPDEAPLDLYAEAVLDPSIVPHASKGLPTSLANVLLTGATGFLGAFLLAELLQATQANVYCLVRSADANQGALRIRQQLESLGIWREEYNSRIIALPGDLAMARLGLSIGRYEEMAALMDAIYHNAALVNFFYPYRVMKGANVVGTEEILRLACHRRQKSVHYVSSMGVFPQASILPPEGDQEWIMKEDDTPDCAGLGMGYTQSKWVAERLVSIAGERDIPVAIYRPTITYGHTKTGDGNSRDFLYRLIYSCGQLGYAPDIDSDLNLVPVDFVTAAIVRISLQREAVGRVFHLVNRNLTPMREIIQCVVSSGFPVKKIRYEDWRDLLLDSPENALAALARNFPEHNLEAWRKRQYYCQNATSLLQDTEIRCPEITRELLDMYVSQILAEAIPSEEVLQGA